ncbi:MAG: alginate export family protein [Bacteroidetes bacterium]|nr:alginate export family protein [Bacteroidota bacterium]
MNNLLNRPFSLRLGRMELAYGNQRIIGAVGWHNIGRSFDGALVSFTRKNIRLDAFSAKEVESQSPGNADDKDFRGVWLASNNWVIPGLVNQTKVDAYFLNQYQNNGTVLNRSTAGIFSKGIYGFVGGITLTQEIDFALQLGTQQDTVSISASLIGVRMGLTLGKAPFKPSIGFGFDRVSGDDTSTTTYEAFNTLYATNHKFYGFMDYFPRFSTPDGLHDVSLSVTSAISRSLRVRVEGHHFASTAEGATGRSLSFGQEVDLVLSYDGQFGRGSRALDGFQLSAGASVFFRGGRLEQDLATDPTWWLFLTSQVSF